MTTNKQQHTLEPWIGIVPEQMSGSTPVFPDEQAAREWLDNEPTAGNVEVLIFPIRRIVACVNACAGIATADLENAQAKAGETLTAFGKACAQRDELAAALRECITEMPGAACYNTGKKTRRLEAINETARAAIAKVQA